MCVLTRAPPPALLQLVSKYILHIYNSVEFAVHILYIIIIIIICIRVVLLTTRPEGALRTCYRGSLNATAPRTTLKGRAVRENSVRQPAGRGVRTCAGSRSGWCGSGDTGGRTRRRVGIIELDAGVVCVCACGDRPGDV